MSGTEAHGIVLTDEFRTALSLLEQGESIFLTGKAGTGKSTLIREFLSLTARTAIVAAPTGIAALNVNGYTIHRLFSFWPGVTVEHVRSDAYYPKRFGRVLSKIDTLVIDEASMVRADLFDCLTTALERFGPRPGERFGGVQVVLVGDLFQLPPVVVEAEEHYFSEVYDSPFFFSARSYEEHRFPVVELTTVFRQVGDTQLVDILNSVRNGSLGDYERQVLNQRVNPSFDPPLDEYWLTLTTTNRIATARNKAMLDQIRAETSTSYAVITGELDGFDIPTDETLEFKVGTQVMLLTNDGADRWVNGSIGKIVEVFDDTDDPSISVQLNDGNTVRVERHVWEVTRPVVNGSRLQHEVVGSFTQLPFRLAWAITIHKSQGQTLDQCRVDLSGGIFADGQLYVALSRCTSLNGLVLARAVEPKHLRVNQRIRRFLDTGGRLTGSKGGAYLGVSLVGDVGRQWKPRIVELAVVTDDGQEATTLVAPGRDVGDSQQRYGITATDVHLAPTLHEAWNALSPLLEGRTPVGVRIDETLEYIDFELKRGGLVTHIPVGDDVAELISEAAGANFESLPAIEKARSVRELALENGVASSSDVFTPAKHTPGFLKGRDRSSTGIDFRVRCSPSENPVQVLAELLSERPHLAHSGVPDSVEILRQLQDESGVVLAAGLHEDAPDIRIADVLQPGVRVCFTGSATDREGRKIPRDDLEAQASSRGLEAVDTVTKTRCDVLVVAERGTQSGKARQAGKFGKPIFTVDEFIDWLEGNVVPRERPAEGKAQFTIERISTTEAEPKDIAQVLTGASDRVANERHSPERDRITESEGRPGAPNSFKQDAVETYEALTANVQRREPFAVAYTDSNLDELLSPGSIIAFSGIITSPRTGQRLTRPELAGLVEPRGLVVDTAVTKARTSVLIHVGANPDSVQVRAAVKYGKPIVPVGAFFAWLDLAEPASHPQGADWKSGSDQGEAPLAPRSSAPQVPTDSQLIDSTSSLPTSTHDHRHLTPSSRNFDEAARTEPCESDDSSAPKPHRPAPRFHLKMLGLLLALLVALPFVGALIAISVPAVDTVMAVLVFASFLAGALLIPIWIVIAIRRLRRSRR
ncbi:AAA family ATPase [Nesterenkonia sp. E16_7]|uniref:AAA family ATPase n=1 Tax=unclassified Nesterenkonia TaxID=2629769 RepID=UPI001A92F608|nr:MULTISPECIES: AAA family ATPase [unclassified Nesterenkonia]MBO0594130.1 AAA family ATPase [Nesterenkonia sp. E16_10]MBO0597576.1 AAA family ATPase [Nesterenkonia sp. E16_7]